MTERDVMELNCLDNNNKNNSCDILDTGFC